MRGTVGLHCFNLLSGVTLRGFHSQVSERELVGKTQASDGKRNGRPLRLGAGLTRIGLKSMKRAKGMLKRGRCGPDSSLSTPFVVQGTMGNENPIPKSHCD